MKLTRVCSMFVVIAFGITLPSCDRIFDPLLPADAEQFSPPAVYRTWWAITENCSELRGSIESVSWFKTGQRLYDPRTGLPIGGYWSAGSNRIVLAGTAVLDGRTVRHEMLHALARKPGHPRNIFLGKCAGVVSCGDACLDDAGPPSPPPANVVRVQPDLIEVRVQIAPLNPTPTHDDGFFSVTVTARNRAAYPVIVAVPDPGGAQRTFSYDLRGPAGGISGEELAIDQSSVTFAPDETKRHVFDFVMGNDLRAGGFPPGEYVVRGAYGRHWSADATVTLGP